MRITRLRQGCAITLEISPSKRGWKSWSAPQCEISRCEMTSLRKRGLLCALEDFTFWTRDDLGAPQRESCGRHLLTSIGSSALLEMTKFLSRPQRPFSLCNSVRLCRCRIRRFCVLDTRRDSALDQRNEGPQDWRTANCPDYMYDSPNVVGFCANSNRWSCFSAQRNGRGIQSIRRNGRPHDQRIAICMA